ncbi:MULTISPECIES: hypothetical protein [unclassified Pseudofrankia]|uniref:hypothetical protein n=1 Tax=unclassified Pseudofrankia TaxID=2994372 RepID=UPI0008D9C412|nr:MULTISPECIES: hypothetical protein [unclassified Pseudofrankia]MDT3445290.1 spheroidene monooxygenase [Pseudofrankia sp. BMG5.37]OHV61380.1 hypothetical protein BCD48_39840 [Pseudofrankia sp. BMG5.36]
MPADADGAAPPLVTVDLWRVPARRVGGALVRMALDRARLRRVPGLTFARLVGTGTPGAFGPLDAEPRRWGLVAAWDSQRAAEAFTTSAVPRSWARAAEEHLHLRLQPVAARGRWSGREPFGRPAPGRRAAEDAPPGPVAVLTRARLTPRRAVTFWRAVPPVAADLAALAADPTAGPRLAIGIGEAPIGLQGTFSVWPDLAAVRAFAYGRPAHAAVVRRTPEIGWYAEELFARFAVLAAHGTLDGRNPLRPGGQ